MIECLGRCCDYAHRIRCKHYSANIGPGTYEVHDYSTNGSGTYNSNGVLEVEYECGMNGNYKRFEDANIEDNPFIYWR